MNFSAFVQAAAEASVGVREVETELEQLRVEVERLESRREVLGAMSRQLLELRADCAEAAPAHVAETPVPGQAVTVCASAEVEPGAPATALDGEGVVVETAPAVRQGGRISRRSDSGIDFAALRALSWKEWVDAANDFMAGKFDLAHARMATEDFAVVA